MALLAPRKNVEPAERKLVLFGLGSVVYGVAIERVREVVNPQPVIALPHAPPSIVGVTHHRGEVVPVVDLRHRFGLPAAAEHRRVKWIMLDVGSDGERPLAAIVDEVLVVFPTRDPLRPAPSLGGGEDVRGILGVVSRPLPQKREQLVFVLDLARLRALVDPLVPATEALLGQGSGSGERAGQA